jgi:hypothetical protein
VHDGTLYALQALNASQDGRFANDLFFAFGSQDRFSIFSWLMGPPVKWLGLRSAFWLGYTASSALFVYAEVRLVRVLIQDRSLANLALVALASANLPYGAWDIFHVQESFLTARLLAEAFSLLAIETALRGRILAAAGSIAVGLALHPLIAAAALPVCLAALFWHPPGSGMKVPGERKAPDERKALGALLLLAIPALIALLYWRLLQALLVPMDESWFSASRSLGWCFASRWRAVDWYWALGSLAVLLVALGWLSARARVVLVTVFVLGVGGLAATALGEYMRWPLLVQGQGYRALWLVELLAVPSGILAMGRLLDGSTRRGRWAALALALFLGDPLSLYPDTDLWISILPAYLLFSLVWAYVFFRKDSRARGGAIEQGLLAGVATIGLLLFLLTAGTAISSDITRTLSPIDAAYVAANLTGRPFYFAVALLLSAGCLRVIRNRRLIPALAALLWIFTSAVCFVAQERPTWRNPFRTEAGEVKFVKKVLLAEGKRAGGRRPDIQVYWPERPALIWFDLGLNSYYSFTQVVGAVFSERTAREGRRRAELVKRFEIEQIRAANRNARGNPHHLAFLSATMDEPPPVKEDLLRLAADENLDWIVLSRKFDGLYSAGNGSVFVYDCAGLREAR